MATKKPAKTETSTSFQVLSNLDHNGKKYTPGEPVELEPEDAEPLLAAGVVKAAE